MKICSKQNCGHFKPGTLVIVKRYGSAWSGLVEILGDHPSFSETHMYRVQYLNGSVAHGIVTHLYCDGITSLERE